MRDNIKSYLINYPGVYRIISRYYYYVKKLIRIIRVQFSKVFFIFPIQKNKIVFCNYYGKGYGDNGKYIANELNNQEEIYDIVWLLKGKLIKKNTFPANIRVVKYGSLRALYEMATARVWVDNCRKFFYPKKRKGQYYIQTWHGGIALKKIEKDAIEKLPRSYVESAKNDSRMIDLLISNSGFCTEMYRSAFWYNGEILECGSPRCDILKNKDPNLVKKIKNFFRIEDDTRILLYAPTFRASLNTTIYDIDYNRLIKVLNRKFDGEWIIILRLHPNISLNNSDLKKQYPNLIDATDYEDVYELMLASDILITDYSSIMFEYSLLNRPVFLYMPDIDTYKEERGLYFDVKSLPYPIANTNDKLMQQVKDFNIDEFLEKTNLFLTKLELKEDGDASKKVVARIKQIIKGDMIEEGNNLRNF